jgi:sensor domain CHASE-containing protein/HPt (histidine-containing phosphotransfer) domain-containing protein
VKSLRTRTLVMIASALALFLTLTYGIAVGVLMDGFGQLERDDIRENRERIENRIAGEIKNINIKNRDWAAWDDAWSYMKTKDPAFAKGNIDAQATLPNLSLDLLVFVDTNGKVVNALQWDPIADKSMEPDQSILRDLTSEKFLKEWSNSNDPKFSNTGIMLLKESPWLLSSRSITTTAADGEVRGVLYFGRMVTQKFIDQVAKDLKFNIELVAAKTYLDEVKLEHNTINQFIVFKQADKAPVFEVNAKFERLTMQQGRLTLNFMLGILTLAVIILGAAITYQLENRVLKRLQRLSAGTEEISKEQNDIVHLKDEGNDELADLTHKINHMVDTIHHRTRQIKEIADHVKFGFFVTDLTGSIQDGYTKSTLALLNTQKLSGQSLAEALKLNAQQTQLFDLVLQQVAEDLIPHEITLKMFPKRLTFDHQSLSIEASLIRDAHDVPQKLLFSIADATELNQVERQNETNKAVIAILSSKEAFASMVQELKDKQSQIFSMIEQGQITKARIELHTINGNLRCFGLNQLIHYVTEAEDNPHLTKDDVNSLFAHLTEWVTDHESITGVAWHTHEQERIWNIPDRLIKQITQFESNIDQKSREAFAKVVAQLTAYAVQDLETPLRSIANLAASKLGKSVNLQFNGLQERVSPSIFQALADILPHLIRNAIDHGIEHTEARPLTKDPVGSITVNFATNDHGEFEVSLADDGQGLNRQRILEKAISLKLVPAGAATQLKDADVYQFIFAKDLSTKHEITEISGRGLGMSAVYQTVVTEFNGHLHIDSKAGSGTTITMTFPAASKQTDRQQQHLRVAV